MSFKNYSEHIYRTAEVVERLLCMMKEGVRYVSFLDADPPTDDPLFENTPPILTLFGYGYGGAEQLDFDEVRGVDFAEVQREGWTFEDLHSFVWPS